MVLVMAKNNNHSLAKDSFNLAILISFFGIFALSISLASLSSLSLIDWLLENFGYGGVSGYLRFSNCLLSVGFLLTGLSIIIALLNRYKTALRNIRWVANVGLALISIYLLGCFIVGSLADWTSLTLQKREYGCISSVVSKDPYKASLSACTQNVNDVRRIILMSKNESILAITGLLINTSLVFYFLKSRQDASNM